MRIPIEERTLALAVSQFGLDRRQIDQAVRRAAADDPSADLIDILVAANQLTFEQARLLREAVNSDGSVTFIPAQPSPGETVDAIQATTAGVFQSAPRTRSGIFLRNIGPYRILRKLGEGGMGTVFLGYDDMDNSQVAIKVLADQLVTDRTFLARFYREAKNGAQLNHPNIVRCITADKDEAIGKHYLVMEYVDGLTARALLTERARLAVGDAVHLILDIARALAHVHARNFIHRDIKPDNILITRAGQAKLADLGLAKCLNDDAPLTAERQGFGTPYYMPCEQAIDAANVDARGDIYALGATLYHLVAGQVPFPGDTPRQIAERKLIGDFMPASKHNPAVPARLDRVLNRMMARHPEDRYQSADELIAELEATGLDVPTPSFAVQQPGPTAVDDPGTLTLIEPIHAKTAAPIHPRNASHHQTEMNAPAPDLTLGRGRMLILAGTLIWSLGGLLAKILTQDSGLGLNQPPLSSEIMAFYRVLFASIALLPTLRRADLSFRPLMVVMALTFALMNGTYVKALAEGSAANAVILQYTAPMWMYLGSIWLLGEPADRRAPVALLFGCAGVAVILWDGMGEAQLKVIGLGLTSGVAYAGIILCLRALRTESSRWLTLLNHLGAALVLVVFTFGKASPNIAQLVVLFFFGAVQLAAPYWLVARGMRVVSPQEAGMIMLLEPILNPLWVYLGVGEEPAGATIVGGVLIIGGLAWRYAPRRQDR